MYAILGLCTWKLGALAMLNLYVLPYWIFVAWLDFVTYLHHHGEPTPSGHRPHHPLGDSRACATVHKLMHLAWPR